MSMIFSARGWAGPYWPFLVMATLSFFYWAFAEPIGNFLAPIFRYYSVGSNLDTIEEVLDNYWSSLSKLDRNFNKKEEEYRRMALEMPKMTKEHFQRMTSNKTMPREKKRGRLFNTHSYDILANPNYIRDFQYVSSAVGSKRNMMIIDSDSDDANDSAQSDFVRICVNLAFLPEKKGRYF